MSVPLQRGGWPAVLAIAAATFLLVTSEFLPIGLLSPIAMAFGVTDGRAGLVVTVPGLTAAFAAPLLTVLAGRLDRRFILCLLTLLIIGSDFMVAIAADFGIVLFGRVLLGLGVGGLWTFSVAVGRRLVPEVSGARATSLISAGIAIGTVVGVPLGVMVGDVAGWRAAFGAAGALGAVILALQLVVLPQVTAQAGITPGRMLALLAGSKARLGLAAILLIASGQFAAYTYLEPWLHAVPRLGPAQITLALTLYGLGGVAGTFLGEFATSRDVRWAFAISAATVALAAFLASVAGPSIVPVFALVIIWGVAFGAVPVCLQIWMYKADPLRFEGGSALMVSAFQIALSTGAFVGGLVVDTAGLRAAMLVGASLSAAGALSIGLLGGTQSNAATH